VADVRGLVPGLDSPVPLVHRIPGVLQDDDFTVRFVSAFDAGFAPVLATLDGLAAYVDPWLAPPDFVDWLAGWVGVEPDDAWSLEQRRAVVAGAALVHRRRGTARGIVEALELALGAQVELEDSGGCTWASEPGSPVPASGPPSFTVRLLVEDPDAIDRRRVEMVLDAVKPAHVAHTYEVVRRGEDTQDAPDASR